MPRRWLKRRLPTHHQVQQHFGLDTAGSEGTHPGWFRSRLSEPELWHLNRRTVAGGVAVGLFVGWLPVPMQMLLAGLLAAVLRVHVPASVVFVWFSNPFTAAPLLYAAWFSGSTILNQPTSVAPFSMSLSGLLDGAAGAWPALLTGSVFCGAVSAVIGYFATHIIWRFIAIRRWRARVRRNIGKSGSFNQP